MDQAPRLLASGHNRWIGIVISRGQSSLDSELKVSTSTNGTDLILRDTLSNSFSAILVLVKPALLRLWTRPTISLSRKVRAVV